MYTEFNFRSKEAVQQAIQEGQEIRCFSPNPDTYPCPTDGEVYLCGPHSPQDIHWVAIGKLVNGILVDVT